MLTINLIFIGFFLIRLYTLKISIHNEKNLIQKGAIQYGQNTSKLLSITHVLFYFSALFEANYNAQTFDTISLVGVVMMLLAYLALFWVIRTLNEIWTVKLYILPNHQINTSSLFKFVRHPNYFLNIIPELLGLVLLCHSWSTLAILFPIYLLILATRIYQEEKAMKPIFSALKK
ncbi:hypothetical protein A4G19_04980 [Pasteurellaceae bacterium Macca]|nr:hypothetical protein [Pasteurellaceae bacterium Macca]